jgi:hypothetical protein
MYFCLNKQRKTIIMKKVNIFRTKLGQLITLENYGATAGVCHAHGITFEKQVYQNQAQAMHSMGQLQYVIGVGDRKVLVERPLRRGKTYGNFKVA